MEILLIYRISVLYFENSYFFLNCLTVSPRSMGVSKRKEPQGLYHRFHSSIKSFLGLEILQILHEYISG